MLLQAILHFQHLTRKMMYRWDTHYTAVDMRNYTCVGSCATSL
jgi:hypothetical protein